MPYVEVQPWLRVLLPPMRSRSPRALAIVKQIAAGLAAAHDAGVVHRDWKPANTWSTAEDRALIVDFGIARSVWAGGAGTTATSSARWNTWRPNRATDGPSIIARTSTR